MLLNFFGPKKKTSERTFLLHQIVTILTNSFFNIWKLTIYKKWLLNFVLDALNMLMTRAGFLLNWFIEPVLLKKQFGTSFPKNTSNLTLVMDLLLILFYCNILKLFLLKLLRPTLVLTFLSVC
jgi:hypothetical protein